MGLAGSHVRNTDHVLLISSLCVASAAALTPACSTPASTPGWEKPSQAGHGQGSTTTSTIDGSAPAAPEGPPGDAGATSDDASLEAHRERDAYAPWATAIPLPPVPTQEPGDPNAGYDYLTSGGYFGCGIPSRFFGIVSPFATLAGIPNIALPGRNVTVNNNPLPYNWNQATNADGISVVYMNCLQCHAGQFNGKLVIGLGNVDADWTQNLGNAAGAANLLGLLGPTAQEQAELDKFIGRLKVIGPAAVMRTVGDNPAEMLATTFVSHRDMNTLAWSDTALFTIPALADAPTGSSIALQGAAVVANVEGRGSVLQRHGPRRPSSE